MLTIVSVIAGVIFVLLAGLNPWIMLTNRANSVRNGAVWMRIHRTVGYVFIATFAITVYFMFMRLKGNSDEVPPRILLHMSLAIMLAPLLVAKVLVARHQPPGARGLLPALGISIFALSFTLVAMNIAPLALRSAKDGRVPIVMSAAFVLVVLAAVGTLLLRKRDDGNAFAGNVTKVPSAGLTQSVAPENHGAINLMLSRIERQTHDAKTLRFVVPANERFSARPGQFLTFQWAIDGEEVFRSYSISSSPTQTGYVEIVPKRVPNGRVSSFLNDRALPGLFVKARGPYGRFCFDESRHRRIVLIAGGSGITPIMSMLRYIDDLCIAVDATLIYCVRTRADIFFDHELQGFHERLKTFRSVQVLSQPDSDWRGERGRLTQELIEREVENPAASTFFLCGPPPFMEHTRRLLAGLQVNQSAILQESFGSAINMPEAIVKVDPIRLEFVRSGKSCTIAPDQTVLQAAEMNGIALPYGCRRGVCGTCATRLVSGDVQMNQAEGLSTDLKTRGYILPCVSRALSDLKLDV